MSKLWLKLAMLTGFCMTALWQVAQPQKPFTDVTAKAGIDHQFVPFEGTFGGGACVFDFNNDGWEDIFLAGGMADDVLYLNKRNGTFENVFARSGLKTKIKYITQGAVSADINRDGWRDLYITTITSRDNNTGVPRAMNLLFLNKRNGTFTDATKQYGLDTLMTFSTGAMFGDVNMDGYPDLYVGNYFQQYEGKLHIMNDAIIVASKQMAKGQLLINHRGKYFEDGFADYGLNFKGFGFGGAFTDFDNDGDLDIIVNHDFGYKAPPNQLLENKYPEKKFVDVAEKLNMQLPMNAMAVAVGDYDNNGWMDYYVTNIRANPFMVNCGKDSAFRNENGELGTRINMIHAQEGGLLPVSWGANFADFDQDGDLDLFVANGCLNPFVMPNPDFYFENRDFHFTEKGVEMGVANRGIGRGSVTFDYDKDGDLDLLVVNQKPVNSGFEDADRTVLYRNDLASKGNWLQVKLVGSSSDLNGIGSKVEIIAGKKRMIREIDGGSSHESQNSVIAHFGLGTVAVIDSINVYWLNGARQTILKQKANQILIITQVKSKAWYQYYFAWLAAALVLALAFALKLFRTSVLSLLLVALQSCNHNLSPAKAVEDISYELGGGAGHYNYAPSVIEDEYGIRYAFLCQNKNAFEIVDYIYLFKGIPTKNGYSWQPGTEILSPSKEGWDKIHVCDPDVRKFDLTYKGESYHWIMTYLGVDQWFNHNQIGLAFSKNIEGPYIKYDLNPLIPFSDTTVWGVGQSTSIVLNDSIVQLFYSKSHKPKGVMCVRNMNLKNLDRPDIGEERIVPHLFPNTYFAMSEKNIFAASELWIDESKEKPTWVGNHIRFVYKPRTEDIFDAEDRWKEITLLGPPQTKFPRNHNPGLLTDVKGFLVSESKPVIYFTVAMTGENWLWSYDLHSATIKTGL